MFINKYFVIFLSFLYFSLTLCFHINIYTGTNLLYLDNKKSLYCSNIRDIYHSDILLPYLDDEDKKNLATGKIIEKKDIYGSRVFGSVVLDIKCSGNIVFDTLTQFDMYQDMIPSIRSSKIISSDGFNRVIEFILTRFMIFINIKQSILEDERLIKFTLDTTQVNNIFTEIEGFWHVQIPEDRPEGYCRVYLSMKILTRKNVPKLIMVYGTTNALFKATNWLKPFFIEKDLMKKYF